MLRFSRLAPLPSLWDVPRRTGGINGRNQSLGDGGVELTVKRPVADKPMHAGNSGKIVR